MYSYISSIQTGIRSSSPVSLLARAEFTLSRSFSTIPTNFENRGDSLITYDTDQNPVVSGVDTTRKPHDKPKASISDVIAVLVEQRNKTRWIHLRSLRPNGFTPEEFSRMSIVIRNNPQLALRFFRWTQKKSLCNHNISSYSTTIHILTRGRLKDDALSLLKEVIRASGSDDLESNSKPLKVFKKLAKTYNKCGSFPFVFDLLIKACLESKKIESAIQIVRMLLSRKIFPNYTTCTSLLQQVSKCDGADKCYELYKEIFKLESSRVKPGVEIFNTMMAAFYQEGWFERVSEIWEEMIELGCDPNCFSFSILMACYCDEGEMDKAEDLMETMRAKEVEFDVLLYNTIISGFCRIGKVAKAEEFFKEMGLSGIKSSSLTYEHLIRGYCKTGNVDAAMCMYRDMIHRGFRLEASTIDELISGLCYGSRTWEALKFAASFEFHLARESFEVLIRGLCNKGKMEEALKLQAKMVSQGYKPSREIYCAFISGYEQKGDAEMAEKMRKEMSEIGLNKSEILQ